MESALFVCFLTLGIKKIGLFSCNTLLITLIAYIFTAEWKGNILYFMNEQGGDEKTKKCCRVTARN